jgi:hypothetical protein
MHADRWSASAWIVALLVDTALCAYLAASVCLDTPWPPPGPHAAEVVQPGETVCEQPYLDRLLGAVDVLDHEIRTLVTHHARAESKRRRRAMSMQIEDARDRLARVHRARLRCHELEATVRVRLQFEEDVRSKLRAETQRLVRERAARSHR